jgi:DNA-binding CsgD family transcriptional regulator
MTELGRTDLRQCLDAVHAVAEACAGEEGFAQGGLKSLTRLVPSELTHLSVCDLEAGHRAVVSDLPGAISGRQIAVFDRHFNDHPLVRAHSRNPAARTVRISDCLPACAFRGSALFDEYYRDIGIDHAMAVPIHVDRSLLVSFVFNRKRSDFTERERARLEAVRRHLGDLFRLGRALEAIRASQWSPSPEPGIPLDPRLTARENEVLHWLASGKTDRDIGDILAISPRTVHKHLQRIYEKLGVETRTAAVVRAMRGG